MSERDLLMIPGPITCDPAVLRVQARPTLGHTTPEFIEIFGRALDGLRDVFLSPSGQPVVMAGSGTLAMDMALCNLIEPGDRVLVVDHGHFGVRMADIARRYGADVVSLRAPLGDVVPPADVDAALSERPAKLVTVTHVDTSTAVQADVRTLAAIAVAHGALLVVDGVCATGGVEFRQDEWGVDVCLTASQKAISVPPGLALTMFGPRALEVFHARKAPVANYYGDLTHWLPVMQAYQARKPAYFGTPPVNLIYALDESVRQILAQGMEARFAWHARVGAAFHAAARALGLRTVPVSDAVAACTLSAWYYPDGLGPAWLAEVKRRGVVLAGGLSAEIRDRYFRIGHMGTVTAGDVAATLQAIEGALAAGGCSFERGSGLAAAMETLNP